MYAISVLINKIIPKINIHVWGGLGSQLNAWALFFDLHEKFPKRIVKLVLHNGGVTRRVPEITFLTDLPQLDYVADYKELSENTDEIPKTPNLSIRKIFRRNKLKSVLIRLGNFSTCNNDSSFEKIRWWVLEIRGHYSQRAISGSCLNMLNREIKSGIQLDDSFRFTNYIGVHYRLGDLVNLKSKSPFPVEKLNSIIETISSDGLTRNVVYSSDSIEIAQDRLKELKSTGLSLHPVVGDTWKTIRILEEASYFVGTPSKISEWIALLRVSNGMANRTYLPLSMKIQMESIGKNLQNIEEIRYF